MFGTHYSNEFLNCQEFDEFECFGLFDISSNIQHRRWLSTPSAIATDISAQFNPILASTEGPTVLEQQLAHAVPMETSVLEQEDTVSPLQTLFRRYGIFISLIVFFHCRIPQGP